MPFKKVKVAADENDSYDDDHHHRRVSSSRRKSFKDHIKSIENNGYLKKRWECAAYLAFVFAFISFCIALTAINKVNNRLAEGNEKIAELEREINTYLEFNRSKRQVNEYDFEYFFENRELNKRDAQPEEESTLNTLIENQENPSSNSIDNESNNNTETADETENVISLLNNTLEEFNAAKEKILSNVEMYKDRLNISQNKIKIQELNDSFTMLNEKDLEEHKIIVSRLNELGEKVVENHKLTQAHTTKINEVNKSVSESKESYDSQYQTLQTSFSQRRNEITNVQEINVQQTNRINTLNQTVKEIKDLEALVKARRDCNDVASQGFHQSGIYWINVNQYNIPVYCDMNTPSGNWTVIQRRVNFGIEFFKIWVPYQRGFGNLLNNFWLGLDTMHYITSSGSYQLRVDLVDFSDNTAYALYSSFSVGNEATNYRLSVSGYTGNAGDSLSPHNNQPFSSRDRDNDISSDNCAENHYGAWWYRQCMQSNLNGRYFRQEINNQHSITWFTWKGNLSLKRVKMSIKRI